MAKQKYYNGTTWEVIGTDAKKVDIIDSGNLITATNVEDALQETVSKISSHEAKSATTSQKGHVQLSSSTTSTSTSLAATASAVKTVNDALSSHKAENAVLIPKAGSTANAILLDIVLTDKKKGSFKASANNTGNMTINGKAFKKDAATQIPAGGVKANKVYDFYYDQASDCVFILAKASGTAQPSDVLSGKTFSNDDGEQIGELILFETIAGDKPIYSDTHSHYYSSAELGTSIKVVQELTVKNNGALRVSFRMRSSANGYTAYGQIYRNSSPVGTLRTNTTNSMVTFTEDITGWKTNDKLQLCYGVATVDSAVYSELFEVLVGNNFVV